MTVAAIEGGARFLFDARAIIAAFQLMIRNNLSADLESWRALPRSSLVAAFANAMMKDRAVVAAAVNKRLSATPA